MVNYCGIITILLVFWASSNAGPVYYPDDDYPVLDEAFLNEAVNVTNVTAVPKDLYIIRTIVYEIGILTDATNGTNDNATETNEEVDLKFYDPEKNGSTYRLDDIPIPIQTNISGTEVTGVASANFGLLDVVNGVPELNGAVLPNAVVKVTQNVSTTNPENGLEYLKRLSPLFNQFK